MESILPNTKQIIIQSSESDILRRELESVFISFDGRGYYSLSSIEKKFPAVVELYRLIK